MPTSPYCTACLNTCRFANYMAQYTNCSQIRLRLWLFVHAEASNMLLGNAQIQLLSLKSTITDLHQYSVLLKWHSPAASGKKKKKS